MAAYEPLHVKKLKVEYGSVVHIFGEPFKIFTKYVRVFDLYFLATETATARKLLHGASVFYQYIDNDDDGLQDNKEVYQALVKEKATMVMFCNEKELNKHKKFHHDHCSGATIQDLQSNETHPGSINPRKFDASLEECFHLVCRGYDAVYPDIFGFRHGTPLGDCMDNARGGYFPKTPKKYPKNAWFTYDDTTCDYESMMYEYIYWAMTSILGAQQHRRRYIEHEWKLCTREEVLQHDPQIYSLLTEPNFCFPTRVPVKVNRDIDESPDESSSEESSDNSSDDEGCCFRCC